MAEVMNLTRRDMVEACKLAGCTMQRLESDPLGNMALAYLAEKRSGETDVGFDEWLDQDLEVEVDEGNEDPS